MSPALTIWPSVKLSLISMPPTCGRTVAVASGVTVPSALSVTLMSPVMALATPTGWAPWLIRPRRPLILGRIDRPDQQRQQRQPDREPHHPRQARIAPTPALDSGPGAADRSGRGWPAR